MHSPSTLLDVEKLPRLLTFARSHDAQLCAVRATLTTAETARLRAALDRMVEMGAVAIYRVDAPPADTGDWETIVNHLREHVGRIPTDAAILSADYPATATPKPHALVPVWPFERMDDDPDVLVACGLFMGRPIIFEALPMLDADLTQPAAPVGARFAAWRAALTPPTALGTVALPGSDGVHAVFASVRSG